MIKAKEYKIKVKVQKNSKAKNNWYTRIFVKPSVINFYYIAEFDEYYAKIGTHTLYEEELEALLIKMRELNK